MFYYYHVGPSYQLIIFIYCYKFLYIGDDYCPRIIV